MRTTRMALLSILVATLAIGVPAAALAASAAPALKSLVSRAGSRTDGRGSLVIAAELPDSATLPSKVVIPIPKGAKVAWVGEIVGTDPSLDPTATYSVARGEAYDIMTVTVREARIGQAELLVPFTVSGGALVYAQSLPVLGPIGLATLIFEVPAGTTVASASPSLARAATAGGPDTYSLTEKSPGVGTKLTASVSVQSAVSGSTASSQSQPGASAQTNPAPGGATGPSATDSGSGVNPFVAIALAAVVGFAGVSLWRFGSDLFQRTAQGTDSQTDVELEQRPAPSRTGAREPVEDRRSAAKEVAEEVSDDEAEDDAADESGPTQVERETPVAQTPVETVQRPAAAPVPVTDFAHHADGGVVGQIKQVAALKTEGLLDTEEFTSAKKRLLDGDLEVVGRLREIAALRTTGLVDDAEFAGSKRDILAGDAVGLLQIAELAALRASGGLTADEFGAAKQSVCAGDERVSILLKELVGWASDGLLTESECSMAKEHVLTGSGDVISQIEELAALKSEDLLTAEEFRTVVDRLLDA